MTSLNRLLNIQGIMIAPLDDDDILQPSSYKEVPIQQKTQISCAQKGSLSGILYIGTKCSFCLLRMIPVPLGHMRACNPNFSNSPRRTEYTGFRINNNNTSVQLCPATTGAHSNALFICLCSLA